MRHGAVAFGLSALFYAPYWSGMQTFNGLLSTVDLTNLSLAGMLQWLVHPVLRAAGFPFASVVAEVLVRTAGVALLAAAVVWTVRRLHDEGSLWRGVAFVLAASLYLSPWALYWYVVAPVALVAALPPGRLTYPLLAFSGTQLIVVRFEPLLAAWSIQTALRYGLPLLPWAWRRRAGRWLRGRRESLPVPVAPADAGLERVRAGK
jgi:hypothetical protein